MITTKPQSSAVSTGQGFAMPIKKKIGDRRIVPMDNGGMEQTTPVERNKETGAPMGLMSATSAPASMQAQTQQRPQGPQGPAMPERYEAQDGQVTDNSLVENRMNGLMNMDNPLMQKSVVNANNISAGRGLQSSSIATENAVNAMYNYALPIAQQDAQTYANQNLQNQQNQQQIGLQDNQALNTQAINQAQNRFTVELEGLRQQNNLGLLDAEQQGRLVELEKQNELTMVQLDKSAELQNQRDQLLQTFQQDNMALELSNQIVAIGEQARQNMALQNNQNNFARQMEYSNAVSMAVNYGIEALGNAMMNPEITPEQYSAITANINQMVQGQISNFQDIYGVDATAAGQTPSGGGMPAPNISIPSSGGATNPQEPIASGGGQSLMNSGYLGQILNQSGLDQKTPVRRQDVLPSLTPR